MDYGLSDLSCDADVQNIVVNSFPPLDDECLFTLSCDSCWLLATMPGSGHHLEKSQAMYLLIGPCRAHYTLALRQAGNDNTQCLSLEARSKALAIH